MATYDINKERQETNLLINKGVNIEVEQTIYVRPKGLFGFFKSLIKQVKKLQFTIHEPTLSTLDRLAAEQLDLKIDENLLKSDNALAEAKKLTAEHSKRMARIVAIAILGQDYVKATKKGSHYRYKYDDKKLDELTEFLYMNVKPSKLMQYVILVNTISNLGDFTNSIRLMSAARTTMPILVEQKEC